MNRGINSTEIKKLVKSKQLVIGTQRAIKSLKISKVQKILMSSNCPEKVEKDINYYAGINGTETYKLDLSNEELGILCKKPFSISVLALLKGAK